MRDLHVLCALCFSRIEPRTGGWQNASDQLLRLQRSDDIRFVLRDKSIFFSIVSVQGYNNKYNGEVSSGTSAPRLEQVTCQLVETPFFVPGRSENVPSHSEDSLFGRTGSITGRRKVLEHTRHATVNQSAGLCQESRQCAQQGERGLKYSRMSLTSILLARSLKTELESI